MLTHVLDVTLFVQVVKGMLLKRDTEGTVTEISDAKVAVYAQGVDTSGPETKGTVLIKSAEELENYSKSEEKQLEQYIKAIADSGAKVVVSGGNIGMRSTRDTSACTCLISRQMLSLNVEPTALCCPK